MRRFAAAGALAAVVVASAAAAPASVTLFARSTTFGPFEPAQLYGEVSNGREGEDVAIQAKDCGHDFFRVVSGARTGRQGRWTVEYVPGITTTLRAVWNGSAGSQVVIRQRANVRLTEAPSGRGYQVGVSARIRFWNKRVSIQRFDRRTGTWLTFRSVVLTEQRAIGSSRLFYARIRLSLPRGTLIRAFLQRAQARPCYLPGSSRVLRT